MEIGDQVDCFDEFLQYVNGDVEDWLFDNEKLSGNSFDNAVSANFPEEHNRSATFRSTTDTRTLAKIRKQARRQQFGSSEHSSRKRQKISHQIQPLKLVTFPSFEKCDSLIFFPHTLSRLMNSGDRQSLVRILHSYFESTCEVQLSGLAYNCVFPHKRLLDLFVLTWEANPDFIMCVHDTKVIDNVISASTYFKYTECKYLTDSVRRMTKDPLFLEMLDSPTEQLKRELCVESKPEQERQEICAVLDSGQDVLVYGRIDLQIRFDHVSKKIVALQFAMHISSVV
jgi:hypothetical protein